MPPIVINLYHSLIQSIILLMRGHHAKHGEFMTLIPKNGLVKIINPEMAYKIVIHIIIL